MRLRALRLTAIAHGILRAFGPLLPLDGLSAAAAFSTRKLRTAYTGAAMRVRRSSDNAEADIGFATQAITRTNLAPNPNMTGGIVGGVPTDTLYAGAIPGTTFTAVGPATVNGVSYYDTRVSGTPTSTGGNRWLLAGVAQGVPVATGQPFTISMDVSIAAGSLTNATVVIQALGRNASNSPTGAGAQSPALAVTTTPQRFSLSGVGFASPTTKIGPEVVVNVTSGAAMDLTLRVGRVCVEVGAAFHVVHIPVANTPTLVVRPGDLDVEALMAHVGSGSGFVTTWYDQSGNARNAAQAGANNQPRIVNAGVVDTMTGKPTLEFNPAGGNKFMPIPGNSAWSNGLPFSSFSVLLRKNSVEANHTVWGTRNGSNGRILRTTLATVSLLHVGGVGHSGIVSVDSTPYVHSSVCAPALMKHRLNGGADSSVANPTVVAADVMHIGSWSGGAEPNLGSIPEIIFFDFAIADAPRLTLERSQGDYFGITVA